DEKIAVIGAGPAGLSCALSLAQKGFRVTVFEKESDIGGALRKRADFASLREDMLLQLSACTFELRLSSQIKNAEELEDFDAVYIATGAGGESFGFNEQSGRFFPGGELSGASPAEGIAMGARASLAIEQYLQTGSYTPYLEPPHGERCGRYVPVTAADERERIPCPDSGYSADEAKAEAGRCLQCDCTLCMSACEMLKKHKKTPLKISTDVHMDSLVRPPFTTCSITRQTYSCNDCGYCSSICPEDTDIGGLLRFSRADRLKGGRYPAAFHDYWLREMDFAAGQAAFFSPPPGKETCEYAFFPGCRLGASVPEHLLRSYAYLLKKYSAGLMLGCCGAPAWWAGDDERFEANIGRIRLGWEALGRPKLIYACESCKKTLSSALPEIELISLYSLLEVKEKAPLFENAAVFDPCSAREDSETKAAVRSLAAASGIAVSDFDNGGRCCGYGGQMRLADPKLYSEITENRAGMAAEPYIVWCSNCREVFAARNKPCAHILDAVFALEPGRVPTLSEKKENLISVKKELMKKYWNASFEAEKAPWQDIKVSLGEGVEDKMEELLLSLDEVKQAIYAAETEKTAFVSDSGEMLCRHIGKAVVVWVRCAKRGDEYAVSNVYCHRMHFREGGAEDSNG
ncbi:MAG: FAD-dependent oxidoreductase, partial [Oscillospiraceae bacterium]|nr:FAD-dependent oxidoreductase [Oscillospiraceae bacterium]